MGLKGKKNKNKIRKIKKKKNKDSLGAIGHPIIEEKEEIITINISLTDKNLKKKDNEIYLENESEISIYNDIQSHITDGLDYLTIKPIFNQCVNKYKQMKINKKKKNLRKRLGNKKKFSMLGLEDTFMQNLENIEEKNEIELLNKSAIDISSEEIALDLGLENSNKLNTEECEFKKDRNLGSYEAVELNVWCVENCISFLVDSGADISVIKFGIVDKNNLFLDKTSKTAVKGISNENLNTMGTCNLEIILKNETVIQKFHVVEDTIPLKYDAILGRDFLIDNDAIIDYELKKFKVYGESIDLISNEFIKIPGRSEVLIHAITQNQDGMEGICNSKALGECLYLGSCLTVPRNNKCLVSVMNVSENDIEIPIPKVILEEFYSDKFIFEKTEKRTELLKNSLRLDHLNSEELKQISDICIDYNDIFYLEGDKLSCANELTHRIPIKSDQQPINTRPYRLPQCHKEEICKQTKEMLKDGIISPSTSPWNNPLLVVPKKLDASGIKKWRVVVDFRKLNDCTTGDAYALPNINEILDQLGNSQYFSTLDLSSGFYQIGIDPKAKPLTSFTTPQGHFEYNRMPMGLKGASATFQRSMDTVLCGLQGLHCFVYVDDIVVYAPDLKTHNQRLIKIFDRMRSFNLKLQPSKCEFLKTECRYLGSIISKDGIKPDPSLVEVVKTFPTPKNQKNVKSFLGLSGYYRKFIENYAKIALPLTKLLKKDVKFIWTQECENAFSILKEKLINPPLLQYPDFSRPFILTTDASQGALGIVLSQPGKQDIKLDLPIAYGSRTLNGAECNYSTIERELLAIIWGVKYFRCYLYGTKFTIVTDHKPILWIFNVKDPGSRLVRWRLKLEEYDYTIVHKSGVNNTNADSLSRISFFINMMTYPEFEEYIKTHLVINDRLIELSDNILNFSTSQTLVIFLSKDLNIVDPILKMLDKKFNILDEIKKSASPLLDEIIRIKIQNRDILCVMSKINCFDKFNYTDYWNDLQKVQAYCTQNNICKIVLPKLGCFDRLKWEIIRPMVRYLFKDSKFEVKICNNEVIDDLSKDEIQTILRELHICPLGGHTGITRTYKRIKHFYKWPNMKADIETYINKCASCQLNKLRVPKTKMALEVTSTAVRPMQKVFLDVLGPLTLTENGNRIILTFQDDLTKYAETIALPNQEAKTIAEAFVTRIICRFGIPEVLLTDQGTNFLSEIFKNVCKLLKIKKLQCTAYHPQSNGQVERGNRTIAEFLRHYIKKDQTDWDVYLPYGMFNYNTSPHTSTNYSPAELLYGMKPILPSTITCNPKHTYNYDDFLTDMTLKFQCTRKLARENILRHKENSKKYYDKKINERNFIVGDQVAMFDESPRLGKSKKLTPRNKGPYTILKKHSRLNYTIKDGRRLVKVHANRLLPYKS